MKKYNSPKLKLFIYLAIYLGSFQVLIAQKKLFVLIGQSNMAGRATVEKQDSAILPKVLLLNDQGVFEPAANPLNQYSTVGKRRELQRLGPGYYFAKTLAKHYIQDTLLLIVNARGGTALERWVKGASYGYYEATIDRIQQAKKVYPDLEIGGLIWHQGESNRENYQNYIPALKKMVANYRKDLEEPELPFIAGDLGQWNPAYQKIRNEIAKIPSAIDHASLVSSDGLKNFDEHHFDSPAQRMLGSRYAHTFAQQLGLKKIGISSFEALQAALFDPIDNYVMVVAHRGDWRNAPENSIPSIQNCIDMGVDMVEIDVRLTKDSIPILLHDKTLDRTTTGYGPVNNFTLGEIKQLFLKDKDGNTTKEQIPTLKEAMLLSKEKILINLDKIDEIIPEVYGVLKQTGTINQVALGSYLPLNQMRKLGGTFLDSLCYMPKIKDDSKEITDFLNTYETELDFSVVQIRFETEDAPTLEFLDDGEKYNSWIWVNTITANRSANHHDDRALTDPEGAYGWLIERGVNMMQTDRPALLLEYLRSKRLHH